MGLIMIDINKLKIGDTVSDSYGNRYHFSGWGWVGDCQFIKLIYWYYPFCEGKEFTVPRTISMEALSNKKNIFDSIISFLDAPFSFPVYKKYDLTRMFGKDVLKLGLGNIITIDDLTIIPPKTKYRQDGNLQPPENLQYRYIDVILDSGNRKTATDDRPVNCFVSPKRKVIDVPHGMFEYD
ncbi:MAG: hypothetical protein D8H97_04045 [Neisseria sp.]|nr:MAG: hypothetical protein D8H97_04045 [Neisseria sp.]